MCGSLGEEGPGHGLGDSKRFQFTTSNERRPNLSEVPPVRLGRQAWLPQTKLANIIKHTCSALSQVNGAPKQPTNNNVAANPNGKRLAIECCTYVANRTQGPWPAATMPRLAL